jgi:hypothetical protein
MGSIFLFQIEKAEKKNFNLIFFLFFLVDTTPTSHFLMGRRHPQRLAGTSQLFDYEGEKAGGNNSRRHLTNPSIRRSL